MPGRHHLRTDQRQRTDHGAAEHRPQELGHPEPIENGLAQRDAAHQRNAEEGGQQPYGGGNEEVLASDPRLRGNDDKMRGSERIRGKITDNGGDRHRREAENRIAPDDHLERIESAAERGAKGAGDPGGGPAADQNAQVAAP